MTAEARGDLKINGSWTNVTNDVLASPGIRHTRGRRAEGARVDPAEVSLTLRSPNGRYANRNPMSPYFGELGRNTPLRVTAYAGETVLDVPRESSFAHASTPDHASLDIVGDIDVRADLAPTSWAGGHDAGSYEVMGKYVLTGNQRSWRLLMDSPGKVAFAWSPDGTAIVGAASTVPVPFGPGQRGAIRATLDVDNGAGGRTVTFYTAPTLAGPWTMLGTPVVTAGTTSIFNSSASLEVGDIAALGFGGQTRRFYGASVRSGIGGTVVAAPDFAAQTVGATSFTDSAGRVWSLTGGAAITDRRYRAQVEVPEWPATWHVSGHDVRAPIAGAGILRRLGQGQKALDSTLRRRVPTDPNVLAYWPMEEGADARDVAQSPLPGVGRLMLTHARWASESSLPASNPLPTLSNGGTAAPAMMNGYVPAPSGSPTGWHVRFVYKLDTPPTTLYTVLRIVCTGGTVTDWYIQARDNMSRIVALNDDGGTIFSQDIGTGADLFNQWTTTAFYVSQSGGTVTWTVVWQDVGGDAGSFTGSFAGTIGRVRVVASPPGGYAAALDGMALGHIGVFASSTTTAYTGAITGYAGETAAARMMRLAQEEGLPLRVVGDPTRTELMGPQRPDSVLSLLSECEAADGGILFEDRERLGLVYRTRESLYNQAPRATIPYPVLTKPFTPVDDDSRVRNDVTISRVDGSSARAVRTDGPLSIQAPEDGGVGVYDATETLNVYDDGQTQQIAGWRVHLGTWDEARYPQARIMLHEATDLVQAVASLDVGDVIRLTDLPPHLPPGPVDLMVEGYDEQITPLGWDVVLTCSPAGPWSVGVRDDAVRGRRDTSGTQLAVAVAPSATVLPITVTNGPGWITTAGQPAAFPFNVTVGGEVATVTKITGVAEDAFGRTVSNGWGTADSGQAWATDGGSAADYAVASGTGRHIMSTRGVIRHTYVPVTTADVDLRVDWSLSAVPVADSAYIFPMIRYADVTHMYLARIQVAAGGAMTLTLRKRDGAETQLGSSYATGLTYTAGAWYTVRLAMTGSNLSAKVWLRSGTEPEAWQLTATDTALTAPAAVGVRTLLGSATTNTLPLTAQFDGLYVGPQAMTVTRSVNGISKAHPAGTPLSLAQPTTRAL